MKKLLKALALFLGALVLAIGGLLGYAALAPMKTFPVNPPEVKLHSDSLSLVQGKKMVEIVCAHCHLGEDGRLSGRLFKAFIPLNRYKPLPYDGQPIVAPPATDQIAYGKYLATEMYECAGCPLSKSNHF
ncbi:MAG: hypothetical protein KDD19_03265 [Phaeodactylibacter sp.]|nr:hypothetical protein [Phaeodactylibacter sp.]MCB9051517.1 hypothetical protein [Lewinellaceae bacterium]